MGFKDVSTNSEQALISAAQQTMSIATEADQSLFQLYSSGVLAEICGVKLDLLSKQGETYILGPIPEPTSPSPGLHPLPHTGLVADPSLGF